MESYLESAFSNSRENLVKPLGASPISIEISCEIYSCSDKSTSVTKYLSPLNFTLQNHVGNSLIEISLYEFKSDFQRHFVGKYIESGLRLFVVGEESCRLLVVLNGAQVVRLGLAVWLGLDERKIAACVATQLFVGLGLSLPMKMDFEQFWSNSDSAVASYTDIELHQLFEGFQVILYLHMCAELKPSATKTEVVETLSKKHSCFKQF